MWGPGGDLTVHSGPQSKPLVPVGSAVMPDPTGRELGQVPKHMKQHQYGLQSSRHLDGGFLAQRASHNDQVIDFLSGILILIQDTVLLYIFDH